MKKITNGRASMNGFAPKFTELKDYVLLGEVWNRNVRGQRREPI